MRSMWWLETCDQCFHLISVLSLLFLFSDRDEDCQVLWFYHRFVMWSTNVSWPKLMICVYTTYMPVELHPETSWLASSWTSCWLVEQMRTHCHSLTYTSLWGGSLRTRACGEVRTLASHALCSQVPVHSSNLRCQPLPLIRRQQQIRRSCWTLSVANIPMRSGNLLFLCFPHRPICALPQLTDSEFDLAVRFVLLSEESNKARKALSISIWSPEVHALDKSSCALVLDTI
jgi:hypothetical protein